MTHILDNTHFEVQLQQISNSKPTSYVDYKTHLEDILSCATHLKLEQAPFSRELSQIFSRSRQKGYWRDSPLISVLEDLIDTLLGHEVEMTHYPFSPTHSSGCRDLAFAQLNPMHLLEEGIYLGVMALIKNESSIWSDFGARASYLRHFLDRFKRPFYGLFTREESFSLDVLNAAYGLLFKIAGLKFSCDDYAMAFKRSKHKPKHLALLERFIDEQMPLARAAPRKFEPVDFHSDGILCKSSSGPLDIALTLHGMSSGLGALSKEDIQIVSFGPQFLPLASMENFGIYRPLPFEKEEEGVSSIDFSGWVTLAEPHQENSLPSDLFMNVHFKEARERLNINLNFWGDVEESKLAFTFFVRAGEAKVDRTLHPGSLDRYVGDSRKIIFKGLKETLTLLPLDAHQMQIIPLAGRDHFWSADFLVAFTISNSSDEYSFSIF